MLPPCPPPRALWRTVPRPAESLGREWPSLPDCRVFGDSPLGVRRLEGTIGTPLPEMVFEDSAVLLHQPRSGFTLAFLAADALKEAIPPQAETAKVASAAVPPVGLGCVSCCFACMWEVCVCAVGCTALRPGTGGRTCTL
jgi:hypothetical protein